MSMFSSPVAKASLQSAVIAAGSNALAQFITATQENKALIIDWVPIFHFFLFALLSTPPNYMWQAFLEDTFPAYPGKNGAGKKEKGKKRRDGQEPALSLFNTAIKLALDQTAGAAANTFLFSVFMHGIRAATPSGSHAGDGGILGGLKALLQGGGRTVDLHYYSSYYRRLRPVDWTVVVTKSQAEFWGLMRASWTFWPFVALFNYTLVSGVQARNLVGSLAGAAWGVYMSMVAAK